MLAQGAIGDLNLIEPLSAVTIQQARGSIPSARSLDETLDWVTWQGTVPEREFDGKIFARWRCWREYGTGVAGDLLVHLVSGMNFMIGWNEAPARVMSFGGILVSPMAATCLTSGHAFPIRQTPRLSPPESGPRNARNVSLSRLQGCSGSHRKRHDSLSADWPRFSAQLLRDEFPQGDTRDL